MKKILGLDLGVSSVGAALIKEEGSKREIEKLAVRIVPEDPDFHGNFYQGNTASKNAERTAKRGARRNNQRRKLRKKNLYNILKKNNMFPSEKLLIEPTTTQLYELRDKAAKEKLSLEEIGRVFIHLNQRRGFLSNRKAQNKEEKETDYKKRIAELEKELIDKKTGEVRTIGRVLYLYSLLQDKETSNEEKEKIREQLQTKETPNEEKIRDRTYLRTSYQREFDKIWETQEQFYPNVLTEKLKETLAKQTIFYQRPLKSQKGLVSDCQFEKGCKATPKSSPYFEMFRIWQQINNIEVTDYTGKKLSPNNEQKKELFDALFQCKNTNAQSRLTKTKILETLGYNKKWYINYKELDGAKTYNTLKKALVKAGIKNTSPYLGFDPTKNDEKGGLFELWHITYSLPSEKDVVSTLAKRFDFTREQAQVIADNVGYTSDYGRLSTKAIRKLLPHLQDGLMYNEACDRVGYKTKEVELKEKLDPVAPNSLRNPVIEQLLNQVVNVVNQITEEHGKIDEIRVELARELKNNAKTRSQITKLNSKNKRENEEIRQTLEDEYNYRIVNGRDVKRYKLWEEANKQCLYCFRTISKTDMIQGRAEIEHIIPKSRSFNNSLSNYIIAHRECNRSKDQHTAYDFMKNKGEQALTQYIETVNELYKNGKGKISKTKFNNLMTKGEEIPEDIEERMLKDTQYIAKETVKMLKQICPKVLTTTGQITDFLRREWGLNELMREINFPKYKEKGQVVQKEIKDIEGRPKNVWDIVNWTKRDDHRHHAIDALICALTDQKIIFKLNNLNKIYQEKKGNLTQEQKKKLLEEKEFNLKSYAELEGFNYPRPMPNLRKEAEKHLESIFISFKKGKSKVMSKNINKIKTKEIKPPQICWTPRGRLHEETIMGKVKKYKKVALKPSFKLTENIADEHIKQLVKDHLAKHNNDPKKAFSSATLKKKPLLYKDKPIAQVTIWEETYTKRTSLSSITPAQVQKIVDSQIKEIVEDRIASYEGNVKEAFKDLGENPLWLNKKKEIEIKSVKVFENSKLISLRKNEKGKNIDFVAKGGNHHALIYKSEEGKYIEKVVPFFDAVNIAKQNIEANNGKLTTVIDRRDTEKGEFQYSMQINDLFVFDLKPEDIDFFHTDNRPIISKKLFRLQKMSKDKTGAFDIWFRHHLETTVNRNDKELRGITWERIQSNQYLYRLTKVRVSHLGNIIKIGE